MSGAPGPLLAVKEVSKRFGGVHALENVSMALYPGEVVALAGDNGAGKSTMIKAPIRVPTTVPEPPNRLAPPITTAAILSSSSGSPAMGEPAEKRPE